MAQCAQGDAGRAGRAEALSQCLCHGQRPHHAPCRRALITRIRRSSRSLALTSTTDLAGIPSELPTRAIHRAEPSDLACRKSDIGINEVFEVDCLCRFPAVDAVGHGAVARFGARGGAMDRGIPALGGVRRVEEHSRRWQRSVNGASSRRGGRGSGGLMSWPGRASGRRPT